MPIGIRVTDLPAAAGTLDDDDEFLSLEDGSLRRATRTQAGPKAAIVQVADTANQFTGTNVETVLAEIQDNVDALVISGGGISVASEAEALAGTDNTKAMTPLRVKTVLPVYPVRPTGGDDVATIQAAIDAASTAGGGVIYFHPGTYTLTATTTSLGLVHHLSIIDDNVHLVGAPGAQLNSTASNAAVAFISGAAKAAGLGSWLSNMAATTTSYTMSGTVAAGDRTITLATPAQAANFAVGDYIFIRTGQTSAFSATGQPDAEINQVRTVDAGTGVVGLVWPTVKPYAQEYYVSGTTGVTSTSVTANAAPFGVANITDRLLHNIAVRGLKFDSTGGRHILVGQQVLGLTIEDNECASTGAGLQSMGTFRFASLQRNRTLTRGASNANPYQLSPDSGSSDVKIRDNVLMAAECLPMIHVHEGPSNITITDNTIVGYATSGTSNAVSMRARGYNHVVRGNRIVVAGTAATAVYADDTVVGGRNVVSDNDVTVPSGSNAISLGGAGWRLGPNAAGEGLVSVFSTSFSAVTETITAQIIAPATSVAIGVIPARAVITAIRLAVSTLFNSDGTDNISVGFSGQLAGYAANVDVSTTGLKTTTLGGFVNAAASTRTALATYTAGGSAPTTGKAWVVIEYTRVPHIT